MIKPTKPQVQRTHEEIFAENMKRFESVKNASELSSAFGYVSICGVWKSFVTEEDKKAYAQAYMDAYNRIKARYESNDWEWKLVVPEIVSAFFAQEKVAENNTAEKEVRTEQNSISAGTFAKAMKLSLSQTRKIAVLCGVAKTAIWKATKTLYSIEEEQKMFAYYSSAIRTLRAKSGKVSVKEIANALCLSVSTVYRRIKARGVKLERGIDANDIAKIL